MIFALILFISTLFFVANLAKMNRHIALAQGSLPNDRPNERWNNVLLIALGQKKMFKKPIPAVLHFFVYAGFILINIEVAEIIIDGITGSHRMLLPILGGFYPILINFFELLAVLVLVSCVIFIIRRIVVKVPRLNMKELNGWPKMDAIVILGVEVVLMLAILLMNAADQELQHRGVIGYHHTGNLILSGLFTPIFENWGYAALLGFERLCWWFHILGIFAFLNYLPFSKHLHIVYAFPNTYYSKLNSQGKMRNMPAIQNEVAEMMGLDKPNIIDASDVVLFGASDVNELNKTDILGAYSCTECGRCTSVCPANITGKLLSPRKIMMDTRDRCQELDSDSPNKETNKLLGNYITHQEIFACTSCQACVEACPINIDPLSIINQLKRHIIMEKAEGPNAWNGMVTNVENNGAPWQFSPSDRLNWATDIN